MTRFLIRYHVAVELAVAIALFFTVQPLITAWKHPAAAPVPVVWRGPR